MRIIAFVFWFQFAQWGHAGEASSLRVATFNLNCRNPYPDQILEAIRATRADVVFLQETTVELERFLSDQLQANYPYFYATGYDGRFAEERLAFASRIQLRQVTYSPPGQGFFGFYTAMCPVGDTEVKLINVHLTPFMVHRGSGIPAIWAEIQRAEGAHAEEMKAITRAFAIEQPVIIAGDFNSLSIFDAPRRLAKMGFVDSFAAKHDEPDAHPTWHGTVDSTVLRLRLDYIFHTRRLQTEKSEIIEKGGSDHLPVVSDLKLIEPEEGADVRQPPEPATNLTPGKDSSH